MSRTRALSRHLVPGGVLAGLALTGTALSMGASHDSRSAHTARPLAVAQAVAVPSVLPAPAAARRASRSAARVALPTSYSTRTVAVGRTFSGYASWYGGSFQGRRTANGERFDTSELTAASRTLPFGTRLRVCRRSSCVIVRINDRGPYVGSRVLDLSKAARDRLGSFGVAHVTATPVERRRVAVRPVAPRRSVVRPAVVRATAAPVQPVLAAATRSTRGDDPVDGLLGGGMLLLAGSTLLWLRGRRS